VELAEQAPRLAERGLGLAAVSYDSVEILEDFGARRDIPFPLLADDGSAVIRAFGLLNEDYGPGDGAHGVPHPGTFVIDAQGRVVEKHFEEGYRPRRTVSSFLVHAGEGGEAATRIQAEHFTLTTSVSDTAPFPGNSLTLALDFEMAEGHHAYAPGDHAYRALDLKLEPSPLLAFHEPVRPRPVEFHFAPLDETVPVYEGRFRLLRDVTLTTERDALEALGESPELELQGLLEFQVCSETTCYPPSSLPLSWTLTPRELDRERVPEALRRR
jgi:hypothetical protein